MDEAEKVKLCKSVERLERALLGEKETGSKGAIHKIDRLEELAEKHDRDIQNLKSFKVQAIAWATGLATAVGALGPKVLEIFNITGPKS